MGFRALTSPSEQTTTSLIRRIVNNHVLFQARHREKTQREKIYYNSQKEYVQEI